MPAPRPDRRRWTATATAVPWAVWAALRATGTERGFPLVPLMAFTPHAAAGTAVPLAMAVRARSRAGLLLSAAAGMSLGAAALAGRGRRRRPSPGAGGDRLRIGTVSLRLGLVDPAPVLDLVRRHDLDVLAVQELTPPAHRKLVAAGIADLLPEAHVIPARPGSGPAAGGAVWTRRPIRTRGATPGAFEQPAVGLVMPAAEVEVTAVHTPPPRASGSDVRTWAADLAALPAPEPGVLRVLAGDFNATPDHAALRAVLGRGWVDAAAALGRGRTWTWRPLGAPFPRLVLDHVLVDPRIGVVSVEVVPVAGSDHRAVVAELALPPRNP